MEIIMFYDNKVYKNYNNVYKKYDKVCFFVIMEIKEIVIIICFYCAISFYYLYHNN